jgi:hypothetical protein
MGGTVTVCKPAMGLGKGLVSAKYTVCRRAAAPPSHDGLKHCGASRYGGRRAYELARGPAVVPPGPPALGPAIASPAPPARVGPRTVTVGRHDMDDGRAVEPVSTGRAPIRGPRAGGRSVGSVSTRAGGRSAGPASTRAGGRSARPASTTAGDRFAGAAGACRPLHCGASRCRLLDRRRASGHGSGTDTENRWPAVDPPDRSARVLAVDPPDPTARGPAVDPSGPPERGTAIASPGR